MTPPQNPINAGIEAVKTNAVWRDTHFIHFGIHPLTASLYGCRTEDIVEVEVCKAEHQDPPSSNDHLNPAADYWAWFDNSKRKFTLIYPKRLLLDMCFPYGMDAAEKFGDGKAYRVTVTRISTKK